MKKMKNAMLVMIGGLLFMTIVQSCKKDDDNTPAPPKPTITSFLPTTARTGDVVTITGTNFTGATAVSFGGAAATAFAVVNATTITATVGAGATGEVSVTTAAGAGKLAGFTFNSTLPPVNGYNSSDEVEHDNLIGYWPFNGSTTEANHDAAPIKTGGTITYVPGVLGEAINFADGFVTYGPNAYDAGSDNTTFGSNDTLQFGFTVSLWAQVPDTSSLSTLFAINPTNFPAWPILGIQYRRHNGGTSFDFNGGLGNVDGDGPHLTYSDAFVAGAFNDSLSWAFLTMTYAPSDHSLRYYANGQLRSTVVTTTLTNTPFPDEAAALLMIVPNVLTIGAAGGLETIPGATTPIDQSFLTKGLTGKIDDIRFFKRQLTDIQVESLFILGGQGR